MEIEVSVGEVVDKHTILSLKILHIKDSEKLINVSKEHDYLMNKLKEVPQILQDDLYNDLFDINKKLWKVEDDLRDCESRQDFEEGFVTLARSVYFLNDQRADIKKKINLKYGSNFIEEKSYKAY